jgi:hypothetical protein
MNTLPREIIFMILDKLELIDLLRASRVNKLWNRLVKDAEEYDYLFIPKVTKIININGYGRSRDIVYHCDLCRYATCSDTKCHPDCNKVYHKYHDKKCFKCNKLYCTQLYPLTGFNMPTPLYKRYCIKCLHDLQQTYCKKKWKECRAVLTLRNNPDGSLCAPIYYACIDKGCDLCPNKSGFYEYTEKGRLCEFCVQRYYKVGELKLS